LQDGIRLKAQGIKERCKAEGIRFKAHGARLKAQGTGLILVFFVLGSGFEIFRGRGTSTTTKAGLAAP
jgi:hypothetical protein